MVCEGKVNVKQSLKYENVIALFFLVKALPMDSH